MRGRIASPRDNQIVEKALTVILEAIWEKEFSDSSHGFRPRKSVQSALAQITSLGGGKKLWVIQGHISKCLESLGQPHQIVIPQPFFLEKMRRDASPPSARAAKEEVPLPAGLVMEQVKKKIVDTRMLEILKQILEGKRAEGALGGASNIGLAQGGILSRQLSNIVMHIFDEYITNLPQARGVGKGRKRRHKRAYHLIERFRKKFTIMFNGNKLPLSSGVENQRNALVFYPNKTCLRYVRSGDDFAIV